MDILSASEKAPRWGSPFMPLLSSCCQHSWSHFAGGQRYIVLNKSRFVSTRWLLCLEMAEDVAGVTWSMLCFCCLCFCWLHPVLDLLSKLIGLPAPSQASLIPSLLSGIKARCELNWLQKLVNWHLLKLGINAVHCRGHVSRWPMVKVCSFFFPLGPFGWTNYNLEGRDFPSCPNAALPSPILPPSLLQGSCTPLMVATLHPPSAGIAPQYSLPLGLGAGVGRPTLLEHTATVLVKQRWRPWRKTCTLPLPLTVPSLLPHASFFFILFANFPLSLCPASGVFSFFLHHVSPFIHLSWIW